MISEFIIKTGESIYEISELATSVVLTESLNDGPAKLVFKLLKNDIEIQNGSHLSFKVDGVGVFKGFVFSVSDGKGPEIEVTAYDQIRYLKAKYSDVVSLTAGAYLKKLCSIFNLKWGLVDDTKYKMADTVCQNQTLMDIMYKCISETLVNTGRFYVLRDEFGNLALRNMEDLKTNLVIGDKALCYDFGRTKSIDEDTYNSVIIVRDDEKSKKLYRAVEVDEESQKKWGVLQYYEEVTSNMTEAQLKERAKTLLKLYNRETQTLELNCLGNVQLRAGNSFYAKIDEIKLDKRLIVKSVTHKFLPVHTMDLEVWV